MSGNTSIGNEDPGKTPVSPLGDGPDRDNETGPSVQDDEGGRDVRREDIESEGTRENDRNASADQNNRSPKTNKISDAAIQITDN